MNLSSFQLNFDKNVLDVVQAIDTDLVSASLSSNSCISIISAMECIFFKASKMVEHFSNEQNLITLSNTLQNYSYYNQNELNALRNVIRFLHNRAAYPADGVLALNSFFTQRFNL